MAMRSSQEIADSDSHLVVETAMQVAGACEEGRCTESLRLRRRRIYTKAEPALPNLNANSRRRSARSRANRSPLVLICVHVHSSSSRSPNGSRWFGGDS
jgi:hypothetical protein